MALVASLGFDPSYANRFGMRGCDMYARNCFKTSKKAYSVWFIRNSNFGPKRKNASWKNTISNDFDSIFEERYDQNTLRPICDDVRLVFAYFRNDGYRFLGGYKEVSSDPVTKTIRYERIFSDLIMEGETI